MSTLKPIEQITQDIASAYMFRFDREHARRFHQAVLSAVQWLTAMQALASMPADSTQKMQALEAAAAQAQAAMTQMQTTMAGMQTDMTAMKQPSSPSPAIAAVPSTPLKTDFNALTTLLGALVGAMNTTNVRVNEQTAAINSLVLTLKARGIIAS